MWPEAEYPAAVENLDASTLWGVVSDRKLFGAIQYEATKYGLNFHRRTAGNWKTQNNEDVPENVAAAYRIVWEYFELNPASRFPEGWESESRQYMLALMASKAFFEFALSREHFTRRTLYYWAEGRIPGYVEHSIFVADRVHRLP